MTDRNSMPVISTLIVDRHDKPGSLYTKGFKWISGQHFATKSMTKFVNSIF